MKEAGSTAQANIVGFNNLYDGTCPSSAPSGQPFAPTVKFAYYVDAGNIYGSPVLSEDGTKVAFVTYSTSGLRFHVVTLGTTGNNGAAYNVPVTPCTVNGVQSCSTNNAVDTSLSITISSDGVNPFISPFVDYSGDIAYVGDIAGTLHKITGVFRGTPSEITTGGWPFTVQGGDPLSSPVYDYASQHIFVTSDEGNLYCIDVSSGMPALCSPNSKISIGGEGTIWDGPIVDSTAETVFAEGRLGSTPTLTQTTTSLGNVVQASMGSSGNAGLFSGDFDNSYYNGNYASGYMYFCGSNSADETVLSRIGFNSSGTMNSMNDGNSYPLSFGFGCTPLTEAYNPNQGKDYLFLGVNYSALPSGCGEEACIVSFILGSEFPNAPAATLPLGSFPYTSFSGIVVDNVSTAAGASQIYFINYYSGSATQASQNGLN